MDNKIVKNKIFALKTGMVTVPILSLFFLGLGIWMFSLLGMPNTNPDPNVKRVTLITAIILVILSVFFMLLSIFVLPKLIKKAEKCLIEYEEMKQVYLKHKDD